MLCGNCRKNQATKTYEQIKDGKKTLEYYCMSCYQKLFLTQKSNEEFDHCTYCGMTAEKIKKYNLVGCAFCYPIFEKILYPTIVKLQGSKANNGKGPQIDETARLNRKVNQFRCLIAKYNEENDNETVRLYSKQLSLLQSNSDKEELVWQKRPPISKQP